MRCPRFCSALVALPFIIMQAQAAESELRPMTLPEALRIGMQQHPQLDSFKLRARGLQGDMENAALSPPLTLSVEVENVAGRQTYRDAQNAEFTLSLSSVIEPRHQRDARQSLVTARQHALATEEQLFALDLLTDITQQFISVLAAQEAVKVQQYGQQVLDRSVSELQKRVDAGRSPTSELLRAKAALAQANIAVLEAENDLMLAKMALSKLWGKPEDRQFFVRGNLRDIGKTISRQHILDLLQEHPDLRLLAEETRLREAELRVLRSANSLRPEWQAGVRHLHENDDTALVFGLNLPLATGSRASGQLKAANAQHQLALHQQATRLIELRGQLLRLFEEQRLAIQRVTLLRDEVVPLLSQAAAETDAAFQRGRYSYMEWSLARNELLAAEMQLIQSAEQAHYWRAELERLSGSLLFDNNNSDASHGVSP